MPLLHPGGRLLALKGERADEELAELRRRAARGRRHRAPGSWTVGDAELGTAARVVVVERGQRVRGRAGRPARRVVAVRR